MPDRLSPRAFAAVFAVLFALAAVPVLLGGILPLVDYPNHLARMALLARLPHDALLQRYYMLAWAPLPNLAMDLTVPPLLGVVPLAAAGKMFVLATFLLIAGGTALVGRALRGYWAPWPLLVFLLLYNRLLLWGILNYLFGLGLAFCALAAMIALGRRGALARLAVGTLFALALFFAHLMALAVYAVLLVGVAASGFRRAPRGAAARVAIAAAPLLVPAAILLATGGGGSGGGEIAFAAPWRKLDLLFSVFDLYSRPFDVAGFALVVGGLGYAYARRWLSLAPALRLPLLLLALAYLAAPSQAMGGSGIDRRVPLALALVICAGGAWTAPRPRLERAVLAAAALLFVARLAVVAASWSASDRAYRPIIAALDGLPPGARLAVAAPPDSVNVQATPLIHLPVLAAALRDAFVPTLFTYRGQQPIAFAPEWRDLAARTSPDRLWAGFVGEAPLDPAQRDGLAHYDYIAFVGVRPFTLADSAGLAPVFVTPRFGLYRVGG